MLAAARGAMSDLQHACAAAHRAMLEQAIADLDARVGPPGRQRERQE
jgi:hypothetical protein